MKNIFILILLGAMLTSCLTSRGSVEFREVKYIDKAISPTITSIRQLSPSERSAALSELIQKGRKEGFPLVEKSPLYDDYVFATFVVEDTTRCNGIEFEVFGIYEEYRWGDRKLYRMDSTDIWYRTYLIPNDLCFSYRFILRDTISREQRTVSDPLNKNLIPTGERVNYSYSVLDLCPDETDWQTKRYKNTGSRIDTLQFTSSIMNNTRKIYLYLPPGYDQSEKKYPVIYLFDAFLYLHRMEVPNVLDNLIGEKKIEPMVAVFIDNPTSTSRLTELPLNPQFKDFVVTELIPHLNNEYRLAERPDETYIGGMSYGGLAAAYIAFEHDSIFGKVLSQSGGFWRDVNYRDDGGAEWCRGDWLINRYLTEGKRSLKLFLDWGLQENQCLTSGRRLVRVLDQKGYRYKFAEFNGWHDWSNSRKTFPAGLLYLTENN